MNKKFCIFLRKKIIHFSYILNLILLMSTCICNCSCHYEEEKNYIILQLKSKIFEIEQQLNNLICMEECKITIKN